MKYELILIRYGEIALKGKATRRYFEDILVRNIKSALKTENISHTIRKEWGRIYVFTSQINESLDVLQRIFGITSFSPSLKTTADMGAISDFAARVSKKILTKEKSFALRVTRTGNHEFTSQDVAINIGSDIVDTTHAKVDLNTPNFELFIEIRNENAYLFTKKIRGTGGMPSDTQGKALTLIDDPKSILAAWYLMRRGCKVIFLNTNKSNSDALQSFMSKWYAESSIHTIGVKENIYESLDKKASEENCDAVVTGHTLNENPSDSLYDIRQLKRHVEHLILHPLIAMGENEINMKCEEIGILI